MPVEISDESLKFHSEMLKLIGSYTQHYNAKTRSNAFNSMVIQIIYQLIIFFYNLILLFLVNLYII